MNKLLEFYRALKRDAFLEYAKEAVSFTDDESRMDEEIEAAFSGPSEEERADMAEYVRELYVGSHNPVENVPDKEGHYPCKFRWCSGKYDKLIKFILGHAPVFNEEGNSNE